MRLLAASGDHATFFLIGRHAVDHPDLVDAITASGNELGDHTWSHPLLSTLDDRAAIDQFDRTPVFLDRFAKVFLARAPQGQIDAPTLRALEHEGVTPVHWSIPLDHYVDGSGLTPAQAAAAIARDVAPGDIVLAHDARDGGITRVAAMSTLAALLPMLRQRGFRVVAVGTLLAMGDPVRATPRPWIWQHGFACPSR